MSKTCTRAELSVKCDKDCLVAKEDRKWWYFLATSAAIFFGGLLIILASRLIIKICNSKRTRLNPSRKDANKQRAIRPPVSEGISKRGIYVKLKDQAGTLITAQTFKGRCLVSCLYSNQDRKSINWSPFCWQETSRFISLWWIKVKGKFTFLA